MSGDKKLRELLNYSTALSQKDPTSSNAAVASSKQIDTTLLDQIMGPDDAKLMLQSMTAIQDSSLPPDQHEIAFENLEALVEQIDNANNLENLKLWSPLLSQLDRSSDPQPAAAEESLSLYRRGACAVIATAVQNNPVSQADFLKQPGAFKKVLDLFQSDPVLGVRRKALFAITSAIRNNPAGLIQFRQLGGWKVFSEYLDQVRDNQMQKRIIFFIGTLYSQLEETNDSALQRKTTSNLEIKTGFPPKLVKLLENKQVEEDEDLTEKILQTLLASLQNDADVLNRELKNRLKALATKIRTIYGEDLCPYDDLFSLLQ